MDIQSASALVQWIVNGVTILFMIVAASLAIKKNNTLCLIVLILGNLSAYYFTQSPLLCMIISIICIIWAKNSKNSNINGFNLKTSKSPVKAEDSSENKREKKVKCRFCKKSYPAEYNGCPYCKKI